MESTSFTVNGHPVEVAADHPHLLSALREEVGVTSPKDGCSPSGQCGACTVLFDGQPVRACLILAVQADGHEVTTVFAPRLRASATLCS